MRRAIAIAAFVVAAVGAPAQAVSAEQLCIEVEHDGGSLADPVALTEALQNGTASLTSVSPCDFGPAQAAPTAPPECSIKFGSSFDIDTLEIIDERFTTPVGEEVAFVATFDREIDRGHVRVLVENAGTPTADDIDPIFTAMDTYANVLTAGTAIQPGPLEVRLLDAGNRLLASCTIEVVE